jgi:hypothetical protein
MNSTSAYDGSPSSGASQFAGFFRDPSAPLKTKRRTRSDVIEASFVSSSDEYFSFGSLAKWLLGGDQQHGGGVVSCRG